MSNNGNFQVLVDILLGNKENDDSLTVEFDDQDVMEEAWNSLRDYGYQVSDKLAYLNDDSDEGMFEIFGITVDPLPEKPLGGYGKRKFKKRIEDDTVTIEVYGKEAYQHLTEIREEVV